jgi:G2/mitotic-specific cyclin 2
MVTRSKPPSSSNHITQPSNSSRLTVPTVSTRTKAVTKDAQLEDPAAQGKRKRSTLGEVTVNKPKARGTAAEKGKAKEDAAQAAPVPSSKFAGVVIKDKSATSTAIPQSRQVLRSVAAAAPHFVPPSKRTTRSSAATNHVLAGAKAEPKATLHVDAMVVDPPDLRVPPVRANGHLRRPSSLAAVAARQTSAAHASHEERERDEMEAEANRVFKKRRTSSEAPEDQKEDVKEHVEAGDQICDIAERELQKHLEDIGREVEADPNGPDWEDLDAEDAEDPMMVSEYVTEIFDYLKVTEVRFSGFSSTPIY